MKFTEWFFNCKDKRDSDGKLAYISQHPKSLTLLAYVHHLWHLLLVLVVVDHAKRGRDMGVDAQRGGEAIAGGSSKPCRSEGKINSRRLAKKAITMGREVCKCPGKREQWKQPFTSGSKRLEAVKTTIERPPWMKSEKRSLYCGALATADEMSSAAPAVGIQRP
ncbi:hypothetical protein L7F22_046609 [Adiantum nelumboides]|nr:hypothetical protein [Adiantum nelumboides]MCO5592606.1 hypothetical protein [Adiantum nelumboides]